jgi:hypothetical protein
MTSPSPSSLASAPISDHVGGLSWLGGFGNMDDEIGSEAALAITVDSIRTHKTDTRGFFT